MISYASITTYIYLEENLSVSSNLVIVESPAKAKTIEKFLGKDFQVLSSYGHIRDLPKKNGIDIENNFEPSYEVSPDKKKVISNLKKAVRSSSMIWPARACPRRASRVVPDSGRTGRLVERAY